MGLIYNASVEDQQLRVFGNIFTIRAGQIKNFEDKMSHFIATERGYLGMVALPEEFNDPEYKASEEGKKLLEEKKREGIDKRVLHLRSIIYNNEVSLRQDLERSNIKADPAVFASSGEMAAYKELIKYQKHDEDLEAKKAEEIKKLKEQIKAAT